MVRKSASFDPPEGRAQNVGIVTRDDPPTIVNSTAAHNNKPTPRSMVVTGGAGELAAGKGGSFRYDHQDEATPRGAASRIANLLEEQDSSLSKENEETHPSVSLPHPPPPAPLSKKISHLLVEVDSEEGGNRNLGSSDGGVQSRSDDLPESLLELSSTLKNSRMMANQQRDRQSKPTMETEQVVIMPSSGSSRKQSHPTASRVVIENMPPESLSSDSYKHPEPMHVSTPGHEDIVPSSGASANKTTYLTRKAHQFSSLKKKRSNNLLQKMFCNTENTEGMEHNNNVSTPGLASMDNQNPGDIPLVDSGVEDGDDDVQELRAKSTPSESDPQARVKHTKTTSFAAQAIASLNKATGQDDRNWNTGSTCMTFSDAIDLTKDALRLTAESDVRQSIQTAVAGALAAVRPIDGCANLGSDSGAPASPEAATTTSISHQNYDPITGTTVPDDKGDERMDHGSNNVRHRWKPDNPAAIALKQKALEAGRRVSNPGTPSTNLKGKGTTPTKNKSGVMASSGGYIPTPAGIKSGYPSTIDYSEMPTPVGGHQTPGKNMFPSTFDYWEKMTSGGRSGPSPMGNSSFDRSARRTLVLVEQSESSMTLPNADTEVMLEPSPEKRDPEPENTEELSNDRQIPAGQKQSAKPEEEQSVEPALSSDPSLVSAPSDEPSGKSSKSPSFSSIYDETDTDFLPKRVVTDTPIGSNSSIEQQRMIGKVRSEPFARKSKEWPQPKAPTTNARPADKRDAVAGEDKKQESTKVKQLSEELQRSEAECAKNRAELAEARKQLEEQVKVKALAVPPQTDSEYQERLQEALTQSKADAERVLQENGLRLKEEHEIELKQVKRSYERKLLENKDQLSLANRKIKLQQEELERLESQMRQEGKEPPSPSFASRHFNRIDNDQLLREEETEPSIEIEKLRSELEKTKKDLETANQTIRAQESEEAAKDDWSQDAAAESVALKKDLDFSKAEYEKKIELVESKAKEAQAAIDRLTTDLTIKQNEIDEMKQMEVDKSKSEELEQKVAKLEADLNKERANQTERKTAMEQREADLEKREKSAAERESAIDTRENELKTTIEELEATSKEVDSRKGELEQSKAELQAEKTKMEEEKKTMDSKIAKVREQTTQLEASKKTFKSQKMEFETERRLAKSQSANASANSPLRTPSPSRLKKPTPSGIPRRGPKPENDAEVHEREKAVLRQKIEELEEQVNTLKTEHEPKLEEVKTSGQEAIEQTTPNKDTSLEGDASQDDTTEESEKDKLLKKIEQMEEEKERLQERADQDMKDQHDKLLRKMTKLEEQAMVVSREHKEALQQFRSINEEEIARIRTEMEQRQDQYTVRERELKENLEDADTWERTELLAKIEKLEADMAEDHASGLHEVQEKEELLQRIETLELKEQKLQEDHEQALDELKQNSNAEKEQFTTENGEKAEANPDNGKKQSMSLLENGSDNKDELLQKIQKLEDELEASKSAYELLTTKIATMDKESKATEAAHIEELAEVQMKVNMEIKFLQDAIEAGGGPSGAYELFKKEKEDLLEQIRNMENQLQTEQMERVDKLEEFREQHSIHVEKLKRESAAKLDAARKEADRRVDDLQREHEVKVDKLKRDHEVTIEEMESSYVGGTSTVAGVPSQEMERLRVREKELMETISTLETTSEEQKKQFEQQIKDVAASHTKELEDLISQLDLVEAEHHEKVKSKEKVAEQKDEIITALSNQLSEALDRVKSVESSSSDLTPLQEELKQDKSTIESLKKELDSLRTAHENFVSEADQLREKACESAREEMIERAEGQFRQANELYVKLKKQYDASKKKVERLSRELKEEKSKLEEMSRDREEKESSMKAELAELKAENAKIEAQTAQKAKDYRREMEGLLKAAEDFEKQCKEAESNTKSAKKALNAAISEKNEIQRNYDTLVTEHEEMKQVCEELMAELEGRTDEC